MNLQHIKAIAFDLDGTLVDSLPDLIAAANAMRQHLDLPPLHADRIRAHVGDGIASLVHRSITDDRDGEAEPEVWEQGFRFFVQYYHQHLTDLTTVYPGVTTAIGLLKALNLPLAVISNKSARLVLPLLQQLGLADDFALILGGDSLPEKKPSALPLLHTCQVLDIKPENLLMVGDSSNDVAAARSAASPVAVVSYGYGEAASLKADIALDSLEQLYDMIKPSGSPA